MRGTENLLKSACALSHSVVSDSLRPMGYSPPRSSVHRDAPGKNTGVVAVSFSRRPSRPRDLTCVSCGLCTDGRFFTGEPPGKPLSLECASN